MSAGFLKSTNKSVEASNQSYRGNTTLYEVSCHLSKEDEDK